ncbi:CdaR family protein, partial [Clostridium perfringens]|uniref:CdaR family protein n=1 Tax=Clostridium perfringens TaxID=1502 RepID=UPI002ACC0C07
VYESILESYDIKAIDESGKEVTDISTSDKVANVEIKVSKGKAVKVNIATSGQLPNQFKMKSIESDKKAVEILGPKEILDTINEVTTTPLDLSSITENKDVSLGIIVPDGVKLD